MYAVVNSGGKQLKVSTGDVVRVEKLDAAVGDTIELDKVSLLADGDAVKLGADALDAAKVVCEVTAHGRGKKLRVFKYKKRKNYRRTIGHRQDYTELRVTDIQG